MAKNFWTRLKNSFIGRFVSIFYYSVKRYCAGECGQRALALTLYTLFAIVPVAALLFGIAKGFNLDERLRNVLTEQLSQHKELLSYVCQFADTTLKHAKGGVVAGVGVFALFVTVLGLSSNIERAFNAVWELPPRRNILRRFSNYISCMVIIPVMLVTISSAGVFLRSLAEHNPAAGFVLSKVAPLVLTVLIFFLIYLLTPNTRVRILPALLAGLVAGILYRVLQDLFVFLQGAIFTYNKIYGSFAALPLFMIWLRWSWEIALFGAEVGFVAQNLDSGMFDSTACSPSISLRSRRLRELAIARNIYAKFFSGGGASTIRELGDILKLPAVCLERALAELVAAKVVCRVEDSGDKRSYVPLQPESLTIAGCLQLLDAAGDEVAVKELDAGETELLAVETRLRDAVLKCPEDLQLVKIGGGNTAAA